MACKLTKTLPQMLINQKWQQTWENKLLSITRKCISRKWPVNRKAVNNKSELEDYVMEGRWNHLILLQILAPNRHRAIIMIISYRRRTSLTWHMAATSSTQGIWVTWKAQQLKRSKWILTGKLKFIKRKKTYSYSKCASLRIWRKPL